MDLQEMIMQNMKDNCKKKCELPERKELLSYLHGMLLITGRLDVMYCNAFLSEATQLLINSIFLYEDGYFDCAFYSVRQASEVFDSMLYLSNKDNGELKKWEKKERFPMDSKIRNQLEKMVYGYKEIKTILDDYFMHHRELINKSHKIIHKQGFDTFYVARLQKNFAHEKDEKFFMEVLKYTIGTGIILFVILEPIALALADDAVNGKLNFDMGKINQYQILQLLNCLDKIADSSTWQLKNHPPYIHNLKKQLELYPECKLSVEELAQNQWIKNKYKQKEWYLKWSRKSN